MKRFLSASILLVLAGALTAYSAWSSAGSPQSAAQAAAAIRGFSAARAAAQKELEARLQRLPEPASAERHLRYLTAEPHMAGTPGSRRVAEYVRDQLRSFGFEADLASYRAWLPHPVEVQLELTAPQKMSLARPEEPIEGDPFSADKRAVMAFNAYSPSGDVTAPVVYVNYGLPEDYRQLAELGVSVEGKIALARYGRSFRGVKLKVAEENKAAGLILFSDPADDGYVSGDMYPRGPWRPMSGIQRGSVYYGFLYSGDPLTPGIAATDSAKRLEPSEARNLPRIPALPISARDAAEILKYLGGPRVPRNWQGGLPMTYHTGPGEATVRLKVTMDYQLRTIWNAVGKLRGASEDEWVVVGNHHDAWAFGAVDPSSGTAVLLELGRALGTLARNGWKPRRTIVLCAWDAEEFGLIGSVEWVEEHRAELQKKAVAYINIDSAVSGPNFSASGTPSLHELVREATREVADPRTGKTVYQAWQERVARAAPRAQVPEPGADQAAPAAEVPLGILGSGSDFTPFYHHSGIPSLDIGSGGEYGVYHSIYDNFNWMKKFGDPDFAQHAAMARIAGVLVLRLAESDVLPFDYETYAREISRYLAELTRSLRAAGAPEIDLKPVNDALAALRASSQRATRTLRNVTSQSPRAARAPQINRALAEAEQMLLSPEGLTGRTWYKHTIFAPGSYAGYAAVTLPGIREAAARGDWETARREAAVLAAALRRAAARLDQAARLAGPG
jgi:N-acetylated-alpha-linked acidic dipeptidase